MARAAKTPEFSAVARSAGVIVASTLNGVVKFAPVRV
jgi:hypothetical protein